MFELTTVIDPLGRLLAAHRRSWRAIFSSIAARAPSTSSRSSPPRKLSGLIRPSSEVRVGDRRLLAALAVAHGTGHGAGALRADAERAELVDPRDRPAAGADRLDVDHRHHDGPATHVPDRTRDGVALVHDRGVGARAADVERDEIEPLLTPPGQRGSRQRPRRPGPTSASRPGGGAHPPRPCAPPFDCMIITLPVKPGVAERPLEPLQVARDDRLGGGVDDRGRRALELARHPADLARDRDLQARSVLSEGELDALLVLGVRVGVEQAHGDRLDPRRRPALARSRSPPRRRWARTARRGGSSAHRPRTASAAPRVEPASPAAGCTCRADWCA